MLDTQSQSIITQTEQLCVDLLTRNTSLNRGTINTLLQQTIQENKQLLSLSQYTFTISLLSFCAATMIIANKHQTSDVLQQFNNTPLEKNIITDVISLLTQIIDCTYTPPKQILENTQNLLTGALEFYQIIFNKILYPNVISTPPDTL